jgi:hypothetical protein
MANIDSPAFQRAFLAVSYLAGRRDADLIAPLRAPADDVRALARRLEHPERERRAEVLARELARLALSLDARRVT